MIDNDEISVFLNKVAIDWEWWAMSNDKRLIHGRDFLEWFVSVSEEMQNDFIEYINGV